MSRRNLRVVPDTNLIVSAMLTGGTSPQQALEYVISRGTILLSTDTFDELESVLLRSGFDKYVPIGTRLNLLARLENQGNWTTVTQTITACRDPKDNKFLELAVSGQASHIITGDGDLLALHPFDSIPIVTPRDFLEQVGQL